MAQLKNNEKKLLALTGLTVVIFIVNYFVCGKPKVPKQSLVNKSIVETTGFAESVEGIKDSSDIKIRKNALSHKIKLDSWGRDPFAETFRLAEFDVTKSDSNKFVLKGIIRKGDEAFVLIGDEILKAGESIGDLKVLDIEDDRVACKIRGKIVTLLLNEDEVL